MIYLITGTPGSGKTLYAVSKIMEYLRQGREVYADINGLNVQGVIPVDKLTHDWRDTPNGSVVVYDEIQQSDVYKKGSSVLSENPMIKALETHRHTEHDIIFITQDPSFLHTHVLKLVGNHFHLHRPFGAKAAKVFLFPVAEKNPNSPSVQARAEDTKLFQYDKKLFDLYTSASGHNVKLRIPKKVYYFVAFFVLIATYMVYKFFQSPMLTNAVGISSEPAKTVQTVTTAGTSSLENTLKVDFKKPERDWYKADIPPVSACFVSYPMDENGCFCKSFDDRLLNLSVNECYEVAENPSRWQQAPKKEVNDFEKTDMTTPATSNEPVKFGI